MRTDWAQCASPHPASSDAAQVGEYFFHLFPLSGIVPQTGVSFLRSSRGILAFFEESAFIYGLLLAWLLSGDGRPPSPSLPYLPASTATICEVFGFHLIVRASLFQIQSYDATSDLIPKCAAPLKGLLPAGFSWKNSSSLRLR